MTRIKKIKTHLRENKSTYIACGVTAVVVGSVTYYFTKDANAAKAATEIVADTVVHNAPTMNNAVCWKPTMNVINFVERSTPSKIVGLLDKDGNIVQAFASVNEAARQTGHAVSRISKNVNGHIPSVNGDVFIAIESIGEAVA